MLSDPILLLVEANGGKVEGRSIQGMIYLLARASSGYHYRGSPFEGSLGGCEHAETS